MEQPFHGELEVHNASSSPVDSLALSLPAEEILGFGMRLMVLLHALHSRTIHLGSIHEVYRALLCLESHQRALENEHFCDLHLISVCDL